MKRRALVSAVVFGLCASDGVFAQTTYASDYQYIDGTVAHAEPVCSTADVCGNVAFRNGDTITIYSEATNRCEAPALHLIRRRGTQVLLSYGVTTRALTARRQASAADHAAIAKCGTQTAFVDFDRGRVRMAVFTLPGGELFVRFAAGTPVSATTTPAFMQVP